VRLFRSIEGQRFNGSFEVWVVANPPDARVEECLKDFRLNGHYVASARKGANIARNLGIEHAKGKVLCFVDDDCVMRDQHFLQKHWDGHAQNAEFSALGGPYLLPPGRSAASVTYHREQMNWLKQGVSPRFGANYLLGGNCSFKRSVFERFRFEERLAFGGTETELFFRMKKAGLMVGFEPALEIEHDSSLCLSSLVRKSFCQGIGASFLETQGRSLHGGERACFFPLLERRGGSEAICRFLYRLSHQSGSWFYKQTECTEASDAKIRAILFRFFVRVWLRERCRTLWGRVRTCFYGAKGVFNKDS
jgi:hypothetical protein